MNHWPLYHGASTLLPCFNCCPFPNVRWKLFSGSTSRRVHQGIPSRVCWIDRHRRASQKGFFHYSNEFIFCTSLPLGSSWCGRLTLSSFCTLSYAVLSINLSNVKRKILGNAENQTWGRWVQIKNAIYFVMRPKWFNFIADQQRLVFHSAVYSVLRFSPLSLSPNYIFIELIWALQVLMLKFTRISGL